MKPSVYVKNLSFSYTESFDVINNLSFELLSGQTRYVVGQSGAGKSTLLRILYGYMQTFQGVVQVFEHDVRSLWKNTKLRRKIAIINQYDTILYSFDILHNIMMPMLIKDISYRVAKQRALELVYQLGLESYVNIPVECLSGGQKKRVIIGRALAQSPDLLLADEPTADLDDNNTRNILNIVSNLSENTGLSVLWVTHNLMIKNDHLVIKI